MKAISANAIICFSLAAACDLVQAQSCPQPSLEPGAQLPTCIVKPPVQSDTAPTLVTLAENGAYCTVPLTTFRLNKDVKLPPVSGADSPCASVSADSGELVVRLPSQAVGKVWTLRDANNNPHLVQTVSAGLSGFSHKDKAIAPTFSTRATDMTVDLNTYVTINYGSLISKVATNVEGAKVTETGLSLPVAKLPADGPIEIVLKNEYGESTSLSITPLPMKSYSDSPNTQALRIELAHIRKVRADERYVIAKAAEDGLLPAQTVAELAALYQAARDSLPSCTSDDPCTKLSKAQQATHKLVRADIDYRTFLLGKRLTFWGGFRTLKPTNPARELKRLQQLGTELQKAHDRMQAWQYELFLGGERTAKVSAEKAYVMGQIKAENLTAEIKAIDTNSWKQLKADNEATRAYVQKEMETVSKRMEAVAKQQDALGKQATALAMSAAASMSGLPVDAVASAADGDIKGAVMSYVTTELKNPNSPLSTELKQLSDVVGEANKTFANLRETYEEVEQYRRDVEMVAATIRDPSMERFLKVGELAYGKLSPAQTAKLDALIEQQKPVRAWLQASYHKVAATQRQLENYRTTLKNVADQVSNLPNTLKADVNVLIAQEMKKARGEGEEALRITMARMLDGLKELKPSGHRAEQFLLKALEAYPTYVSSVNTSLWYSLKARHPSIGDNELLVYFLNAAKESAQLSWDQRQDYLARTGMGFLNQGKFVILNQGNRKVFDVDDDIIQLAPPIDPLKIRADAHAAIESLVATLSGHVARDRLLRFVAGSASPESAGRFIAQYVTTDDNAAIWNKLKTSAPALRTEAEQGVRHLMAASIATPAAPRPPIPSVPNDPLIPQSSAQDAMQNQMIGMAMNAAFPGAGTALQLAQTFGSMDANRQLNEQLNEQNAKLMSAHRELSKALTEADFSEAISLKEHARAVALAEAAKAQLEHYNSGLDAVLATTQDQDMRLRLFRPYFFYLAEMMRQRFDAFDRSLAMWSGATDSRGFFAAQIATDPQLARLALDSEIHLFDWLNRDREASKTDPFKIFLHWTQLVSLAENYCSEHGCTPGDNRLGQIGVTSKHRALADLAPVGTVERFRSWKQSGMPGKFRVKITLDPTRNIVPAHFYNVRNLDWNVNPVGPAGRITGSLLAVRHLGHSRISYENTAGVTRYIGLRDEATLPHEFMPSNRVDSFDTAKLARRFGDDAPLANLEGWGLYGTYELSVSGSDAIKKVDDFEVEVAYIYTDPGNIGSERMFASRHGLTDASQCAGATNPEKGEVACRTIFYYGPADCKTSEPIAAHRWLAPSAGLEYLAATAPTKADGTPLNAPGAHATLCRAEVPVSIAKRAMDWQRATTQCSWAMALSDIKAMDAHGDQAKLQCKELGQ